MYICDNFRSELYKFMIPEETNYKEYIPRLAMSLGINKTSYNEKGEMLIGHMPLSLNPY